MFLNMLVVLGAKLNNKSFCTMKIYEILSLNAEFLKRLHDFGIDTKDYKSVEIYKEYVKMRGDGQKVVYIVAALSDKFNICERTVYKIVDKMEKDCNLCSLG